MPSRCPYVRSSRCPEGHRCFCDGASATKERCGKIFYEDCSWTRQGPARSLPWPISYQRTGIDRASIARGSRKSGCDEHSATRAAACSAPRQRPDGSDRGGGVGAVARNSGRLHQFSCVQLHPALGIMSTDANRDVAAEPGSVASRDNEPRRRNRRSSTALLETAFLLLLLLGASGVVYLVLRVLCCGQ